MKISQELIFYTSLYTSHIDWDDTEMENFLFSFKTSDQVVVFNEFNWQSINFFKQTDAGDFIGNIVARVNEVAQIVYKNMGIDKEPTLERFWINSNESVKIDTNYSVMHNHPGNCYSAVVYLKAKPNCGDLVLVRPDSIMNSFRVDYNLAGPNNATLMPVIPVEHKVVFFPSSLYHYVKDNESGHSRVSMAFDFN